MDFTSNPTVHTAPAAEAPCLDIEPLTREAAEKFRQALPESKTTLRQHTNLVVYFAAHARARGRQLRWHEAKRLLRSALVLLPCWQQALVLDYLEAEEWQAELTKAA